MSERTRWALRGVAGLAGLPAIVLMSAMIGFGGLAREAGLTLPQVVFATFGVWALPSMIVLVGSITAGLGLLPTAMAVALASVRFTPMVMSLVAEVRDSRTRTLTLYALSHFVAITAWVHGTSNFPRIPRQYRTAFFGGFAIALAAMSTVVAAISHQVTGALPTPAAAALVFLTPIYFLTALWAAARLPSDRPALLAGLVAGPLAQWLLPSAGLVVGGVVAGTLAYLWTRSRAR